MAALTQLATCMDNTALSCRSPPLWHGGPPAQRALRSRMDDARATCVISRSDSAPAPTQRATHTVADEVAISQDQTKRVGLGSGSRSGVCTMPA